jgi:hypothetical protein
MSPVQQLQQFMSQEQEFFDSQNTFHDMRGNSNNWHAENHHE